MPADEQPAEHDPTGGELARLVARAYRGGGPDAGRGGARRPGAGRTPHRFRAGDGAGLRAGPGPDDWDPQRLDQTLSRLVADRDWVDTLAVHGLFSRWDSLVGVQVAQHCRPEQFVDGRLAVRADSTAWATEMRLLVPTVLQRLNDQLGDGTVGRIEVRGPQPPSWRHGRFTVRGGRGPRDTYG